MLSPRAWRPGVVVHHGINRIVFGQRSGGVSSRTERLRDVFNRTAVNAVVHADIRVALWEKFVLLAATGGVMAMTRLPMGPIKGCPETSKLFRGAIEEAATVGRALGVPLPADCVDQHWTLVSGLDPSASGSMLQDLLAGRRLELEALKGTVVSLGRHAGIPTPLNFAVYAALKPYAGGAPTE